MRPGSWKFRQTSDTLSIDVERQQLCLVWRGVTDIRSEEGDEIVTS